MNAEQSSSEVSPCPSTRQLRELLDGDCEFTKDVVLHLENCGRCKQLLTSLTDDDTLKQCVDKSRTNPKHDFTGEPEFAALRNSLNAWNLENPLELAESSPNSGPATRPPTTVRVEDDPTDNDRRAREFMSLDALRHRLPAGRFVVERLIATGGSGAVYLAHDMQLHREVAIKVLASESLRDRQRFLREARMLAELEHPNVVRIFDVGTLANESGLNEASSAGQLYIVMEYISGGTASLLCVDQPSWSAGQITFQRLANLIATAADGLAAAHARSLVHRDVKPGNLLLLDDWSAIKVADFGLAKLGEADATQVTRTGDILGTPVFMSPEQVNANASITQSSDIYSLGATLYQLLTGVAPYQGGPAAVLRQIVESSPVAPRLIAPSIPVDLETICLHAMQHEPAGRYATMQQFAADLRSFARGDAILARPISITTKAIRFLRRNKSFALVLAACVGLVCLLTVGSAAAAIVFRNKNQQLTIAANAERDAKRAAEDALKASITAADELLLAVTTETEFLPRAPGSQEVTRKLLERARDYFRKFLDANQGNSVLAYQLARAHAGLAQVAMRVGDTKTLESETEAALALIDQIPAGEIDPAERAAIRSNTLVVLGNYLTEAGEAKRSAPIMEEATTICKEALKLLQDQPADQQLHELQSSYATALFGSANALNWLGKREESLPRLKEARELFGQLRTNHPKQATFLRSAAACDITLATIALDLNQASEGKGHLLDALELLNQVAEDDAISLRIRELKIKVLTNLALAERRMGNNLEAKAGYEAVIVEAKRLIELEPGVTSHPWNLVVASMNSGGPEMELGNLEALIERWQATVPVLDKLIADDPSNQRYQQVKAMLQSNIAIILRDMGRLEEAISPLKAATDTLQTQAEQLEYASESYLPVALNHYELASTFIQLERWQEALASLDASDAIVATILQKDPVFTPARGHLLDALHARIQLLLKQPNSDHEALSQATKQSLELARDLAAKNLDVAEYQIELPRAINDLAQLELNSAQFSDALATVQESQKLLDAIQVELDKSPDKSPLPPEFRVCRKVSLLIKARAMVGMYGESVSDAQRTSIGELIEQARQFDAAPEELKEFDEFLSDKSQK